MRKIITDILTERNTGFFDLTFKDENRELEVPTALTWTLSRQDGTIVNSRSAVNYTVDKGTGVGGTLASTVVIILKGADLALLDRDDNGIRILLGEATYTSTEGAGLPLKDSCEFTIAQEVAVAA